ncbi:MAG: L-threonylcarbamoyladenylate synthase [Nocardioidaceae bacterium]
MSDVYLCTDPEQRSEGFEEARLALARSGLVVMPTDTVYGVAADAFDPTGVRRLLRAKGRGRNMPPPVLVGSMDSLRALATGLSGETRTLANVFWPGGLTLICRQQPSLQWDLGDSRGTVALRMPDHDDAVELLEANGPLAVSSANTTGRPPAVTVEDAREMLADSVEVYLDAGPTPGPTPSTIVDATGDVLTVVRAGVVTTEALREVVPDIEILDVGPSAVPDTDDDLDDDPDDDAELADGGEPEETDPVEPPEQG